MKIYAEWVPTQNDRKGLNLPERQDWLVLPVILTRDSGCLEQSNFDSALNRLKGESDTLERHHFGHWACGWFDILLLCPSREAEGEALERRLEDYPVLDENDFSQREWEAYGEAWASYGQREFVRLLVSEYGLSNKAEALLEAGDLQGYYEACRPSGEFYVPEGDGVRLFVRHAVDHSTREQVAGWLRELRREARKGKENR